MPEWHKIRTAIAGGAASTREVGQLLDVVPGTISAALRRMPDGEEQRKRMTDNRDNRQPASAFPAGGPEVEMPPEAVQILRDLSPHYDEYPAPKELAITTARLLYMGVALARIAELVGRPFYIVQGWAAQGGYYTKATLARHAEIREAIECGAASLQDVADLTGMGRERVRQLTYSMPDQDEVYRRLNVKTRRTITEPIPVASRPQQQEIEVPASSIRQPDPARHLTGKEITRLKYLIDRSRSVQRNATPQARRVMTLRDQLCQKLHHEEGISIAELAVATGEHPDSVRDWTSFAKSYRRQLITASIARKKRARKRS